MKNSAILYLRKQLHNYTYKAYVIILNVKLLQENKLHEKDSVDSRLV